MPHPQSLPSLFLDRSLGREKVPNILKAAELDLITLSEFYGVPADESVTDVQWLQDATELGRICLLKDRRVHRNQAERRAVRSLGARCFCLDNQNLDAAQMAGRYLASLSEMVTACREKSAPFMYVVRRGKIEELSLED